VQKVDSFKKWWLVQLLAARPDVFLPQTGNYRLCQGGVVAATSTSHCHCTLGHNERGAYTRHTSTLHPDRPRPVSARPT